MFSYITFLVLGLSYAVALPANDQRVVGGSETTIEQYPYSAALLYTWNFVYWDYRCGSTIITNRAVLTAGHCVARDSPIMWRIRVGSVYANYGGVVHLTNQIIVHPNFNITTHDNDVAIVLSATNFVFTNAVRAASIAGANYNLADNTVLWAIGWGAIRYQGYHTEVLRHVQVSYVNLAICRSNYLGLEMFVTDNMLCSGALNVGGRDQCNGDEGSPVIHRTTQDVVVGIRSWGMRCGLARYPGVSTRVSQFSTWIYANA